MAGNMISDNALDRINKARKSKGLARLNQAHVAELSKGGTVDTKTLETAPVPATSSAKSGASRGAGGVRPSGTPQTSTSQAKPASEQPSSKPTTQSG